jgi:hypothetical protein
MSIRHRFIDHVTELKPIRRYEILCECEECSQNLYQYRMSVIIEGFELNKQTALKVLETDDEDKYPIQYIKGKFIHTECLTEKFNSSKYIAATLARLAFYRIANDDDEFFQELKQVMKEVRHQRFGSIIDPQIDELEADKFFEDLHQFCQNQKGKL